MKLRFLAGAAAGYVLGARAGRERYAEIQQWFGRVAESDVFNQARTEFKKMTGGAATSTDPVVAPPVIVGPGPDGATGSPNADVVLPDLESSTRGSIKGDIPATGGGDEGTARRLDPPSAG